ncbi:MAG: hypothetical protein ABJB12_15590 [Pseudomonadota bacterium]
MSLRVLWFVCLVTLLCQGCGKSKAQSHSATPANAGASAEEHDDPLATSVGGQAGDTSSPASTTGAPSAGSNAPRTCAELSQLACRKLAECAPFALSTGYGTEAACTAAVAAACAHFDASGAPVERVTCADALNAPNCQGVLASGGVPKSCLEGPGRGAAEDQCGRDADCRSLTCDKKSGCGKCVGYGEEGAACEASADCKFGLLCAGGRCGQATAPGAKCDLSGSVLCSAGTFCVGGSCKPNGAAGEACDPFDQCDVSHGLTCSNSTCTALKVAKLGASCSSETNARCAGGTFCGDAKTCENAAAEGEPCSNSKKCQTTLTCVNGHCSYEVASTCN